MKNLFDPDRVKEVKERIARLRQDSPRQWGKMTAPQAVAQCAIGMQMALGDFVPPRTFIGRMLGGIVRSLALRDDAPMRRNSPTIPSMVITDDRDLGTEQQQLIALIDRFAGAGPRGCTTHPHSFFGKLTSDQWAILMYKHLDHHLRQFGV
jgi:hypothetical protein